MGSLWRSILCTTSHSSTTIVDVPFTLTYGVCSYYCRSSHITWIFLGSSHMQMMSLIPQCTVIVNPPFPRPLKRLTTLCKKTERCFISAWFDADTNKTRLKRKRNLHKISLECFLSRYTFRLKNKNTKRISEDPPWFIYCTSLLAAAVTCHNCLAEQI